MRQRPWAHRSFGGCSQFGAKDIDLRWSNGTGDLRRIDPDELALVLNAVSEDRDGHGLSHRQIDAAFQQWFNKRCKPAKAKRLLDVLVALGLIEKTGSYSVGVRGNVYSRKAWLRPEDIDLGWLKG